MTSYTPPVKAAQWIGYLRLLPRIATGQFQNNPTLAAGDVKVSIDGGALANISTLPVVTPASSDWVKVTLSAAEMNGDNISVQFIDAAGAEWCDDGFSIATVSQNFDSLIGTETAEDIATIIIAAFGTSGSAASAGASLASTDVDICNLALDLLKEAPITTLTDGTPEANWLLRNYVTARNAELREHPWKFALKRRVLYPREYVMDGITAILSGAWAPFRLTQDWSGDLITIRRDSDSTSDDFEAGTDEITVDVDAIGTFIGTSGTGYVSQLYDQSGNARPLVQATTTKQPAWDAEAGDNSKPALSFDGSNDLLETAAALSTMISTATGYIVLVGLIDALTLDSATTTSNHLLVGDASSKIGLYARKGGTLYGINDDGSLDSISDASPLEVPFVAELRHESGTLYTRVNGENEESATSGATSSLAGVLNVGDLTAGSQATNFNLFALLTFSTIPTLAERNRIVSRLMRWAAVPGAKDFGWAYRYPLPSDCLRMLQIRTDGEFEGEPVPHEVEQGYILTDKATALYSRYIQEFTDASRFDPLFVEAIAAKLAFKAAHWITGKASMANTVKALYDDAIARAKRANAFESTAERVSDNDVINVRHGAGIA